MKFINLNKIFKNTLLKSSQQLGSISIIKMSQINQLRQQNQRLLQENQTLKQSLEQLIAVNSELTQSIQQFSNNNNMSDRVKELENQNKSLKNQLNNTIRKLQASENKQKPETMRENQQLTEVIKDLFEKSNASQRYYEQQISKLTQQLQLQKRYSENQIRKIEEKHANKIKQYQQTITQLKKKNENLNVSIEQKVLKQSQQLQQNQQRKSLKVSTTIQDLRNVLNSQIQQKDRIIRVYENLIGKLKEKIKQKI